MRGTALLRPGHLPFVTFVTAGGSSNSEELSSGCKRPEAFEDEIGMNRKDRLILDRVYQDPTESGLQWPEIERLFQALGARVRTGTGTRACIALNDRVLVIDRPQLMPELRRYQVEAIREFLSGPGPPPEDD